MKKEVALQQNLEVNLLQTLVGLFRAGIDYLLQEQNNQMRVMFDEYLLNNEKEDKYLKIKQVCDLLGIERQTLNNWKKKGVLKPDSYIGKSPVYLESKILTLKKQDDVQNF